MEYAMELFVSVLHMLVYLITETEMLMDVRLPGLKAYSHDASRHAQLLHETRMTRIQPRSHAATSRAYSTSFEVAGTAALLSF